MSRFCLLTPQDKFVDLSVAISVLTRVVTALMSSNSKTNNLINKKATAKTGSKQIHTQPKNRANFAASESKRAYTQGRREVCQAPGVGLE